MEKERIRIALACIKLYCDNVHLERKNHNPIKKIMNYGRSNKLKAEEIEAVKKMTVGKVIQALTK